MKTVYGRHVLRTVRNTLSRFLAIFAIVALGVGFLAGLLASPADMRTSADTYFDAQALYDLRVLSTLGLTEDDLAAVRAVPGVDRVMPARDRDLVVTAEDGVTYTARFHTLPEEGEPALNLTTLSEGRLPREAGECAVILTRSFQEEISWVGRTIWTDRGDDDTLPEAFTVVGTAYSPVYLSLESERTTVGTGKVDLMAVTVAESFTQSYYSSFYLTAEGAAALDAFGTDYADKTGALAETLEDLGGERSELRYRELLEEGQTELADARAEYEEKKAEAEQELADAREKLSDGERELEENAQKLADAEQELDEGKQALESARQDAERQLSQAQRQLDEGRAQLNAYRQQLSEGEAALADGEKQLEENRRALDAGEAQLAQAKAELDSTQAQLAALTAGKAAFWQAAAGLGLPAEDQSDEATLTAIGQLAVLSPQAAAQFAPLRTGLEALAAEGKDLDTASAELEAGLAACGVQDQAAAAARAQLEEAEQSLARQRAAWEAGRTELERQSAQVEAGAAALRTSRAQAQAQLESGQRELDEAQAEIEDGRRQLAEGRQELEDARREYEAAKAEAEEQLADAAARLEDGEQALAELESGKWIVSTREDNVGFSSYASNADKIGAIAQVFPAFFFLVAALVALTTMTRLVDEERQQIGTLKALGYSTGRIAAKYLLYAGLASVGGSIAGLLVGMRVFPYIIITAYNIMYTVPKALTPLRLPEGMLAASTATLCTMLATYSACRGALREPAASLMLPKAPKAGKRIFLESIGPVWRRLSFTQKVTARNLLRYKKRFFMTVIGIAGCTALLVTGFGLRDSIFSFVDVQYGEIDRYQLMLTLGEDGSVEDQELSAVLDGAAIEDWLAVTQEECGLPELDGSEQVILLVPPEPEAMGPFITLRQRSSGEAVPFGEDSAVLTEKLAERLGVRAGDSILVEDQAGRQARLTVSGICENYIYHYLYVSPSLYEKAFGEPAGPANTVLCILPADRDKAGDQALSTALMDSGSVIAAVYMDEIAESFDHSIRSLNIIVIVLILSAGALAFVVLYNLTNINIDERTKEIATIKVLGFYDPEVGAYIYRENAVLTLIGTMAGLLLGVVLHQFVIRTAELDMLMFGRTVQPLSFVWSALLTVAFSMAVNLVMNRRLKAISMAESMKAPE